MPYPRNQKQNTGSYVPTTNVWDVSRLYEVEVGSPEFKELLVRLYQNVNLISIVLNTKATGYYLNEEFVSSKLFFNPASTDPLKLRGGFLKAINTGALGAGVTSVNHGIAVDANLKWMFIYGAATNTSTLVGVPLPYVSAANTHIQVSVTATQVVINNNSGQTFTDSQVTLEYVKF